MIRNADASFDTARAKVPAQRPQAPAPGPARTGWTQRRRIAAILRLAFRFLIKGKKRSVGALGRGAARRWRRL